MHGNVWEWCQDPWHGSYDGAPTDGSAWIEDGDSTYRVRRGGSWFFNPGLAAPHPATTSTPTTATTTSVFEFAVPLRGSKLRPPGLNCPLPFSPLALGVFPAFPFLPLGDQNLNGIRSGLTIQISFAEYDINWIKVRQIAGKYGVYLEGNKLLGI
jgi:hypothetical protein